MLRLPSETIDNIRLAKRQGASLATIARELEVAKSTVSLYCRNIFAYPYRQYATEEEFRAAIYNRVKLTRAAIGRRSRSEEYQKRGARNHGATHTTRKLYPCLQCGMPIHLNGGICRTCYAEKRRVQAEVEQAARVLAREQQRAREEQYRKRRFPVVFDPCSMSPTGAHYWLLDNKNTGICKYCTKIKQFPS